MSPFPFVGNILFSRLIFGVPPVEGRVGVHEQHHSGTPLEIIESGIITNDLAILTTPDKGNKVGLTPAFIGAIRKYPDKELKTKLRPRLRPSSGWPSCSFFY